MKIIVCMKIVIDPEAPVSMFKVDADGKRIQPMKGVPPVLNPFDENALEAALKIKDSHNNATITILSMGRSLPRPVVRKSLATGADDLVVLEDDSFEGLDSYSSANILALALKKMGNYDLILCGREAADTDSGQVGSGIAELLGIPSVTLASNIKALDDKLVVERVLSDGYETIEAPLPALVTVSSEMGTLRTAALAGIMAAQKKPMKAWNAKELNVAPSQYKKITLSRLFQPVRETKCELVQAAKPEEAGAKLATRLKEVKII
jgi:electron transfer flavoprotein beta subunit